MSIGNLEVGNYKIVSTSGNVKAVDGALLGFLVNSTSAGTVILYDDAATGTSTPITGTITPAANTFITLPVAFSKGLNVVVGGTINITLVYV